MPSYRISTIASLLGVSDDTVRRWLDDGLIAAEKDSVGPTRVDGKSVVKLLAERPEIQGASSGKQTHSIRNHLSGLVLNIQSDSVMSLVEMQCGPYRITSAISSRAVKQLDLEVGSMAVALIKSTDVSIQLPEGDRL